MPQGTMDAYLRQGNHEAGQQAENSTQAAEVIDLTGRSSPDDSLEEISVEGLPPILDPHGNETPESFDHTRMDPARYRTLREASYHVAFLALVRDYVHYLRVGTNAAMTDREDQSMTTFVTMVNNKVGWSMARMVVPEFKQLIPDPVPDSCSPLLAELFNRVRCFHSMYGPEDIDVRARNIPQYERNLHFQRLKSVVSCLQPGTGHQEEVEELTQDIAALGGPFSGRAP